MVRQTRQYLDTNLSVIICVKSYSVLVLLCFYINSILPPGFLFSLEFVASLKYSDGNICCFCWALYILRT